MATNRARTIALAAAVVVATGAGVTAAVLQERPVAVPAVSAFPAVAAEPVAPQPTPVVQAATVPAPRREPAPAAEPVGDPINGPPPGPVADTRPARTAAPADRYAFLVGVQHYRAPTHPTIGSAVDVQHIQARLLEAGWLSQNIRVVTDGQATGAAIRDGMTWLVQHGRPGTFSFFHYSGHVKQQGGGTEALWPIDRAFVPDRDVTRTLSQVRGKLWVDVAGCEAGSFQDGLPSDRVLFTGSSSPSQKSYEYPGWGTSVWTGLMFDVSVTEADADHDGRVTIGERIRYSTYSAQLITRLQVPHGRQTPQHGGDLVLGWTLDAPPA